VPRHSWANGENYRANSVLYARNREHEIERSARSVCMLSTSLYVPIFQIVTGSLKRIGGGLRRATILRLSLKCSNEFGLAATLKIIARGRERRGRKTRFARLTNSLIFNPIPISSNASLNCWPIT
jgi:hypothetical protein